MALSSGSRTGVAAILAGVLIFAGQAGELVFGNAPTALWVALGAPGIAALFAATGGWVDSSVRELVGSGGASASPALCC
jgi:hypothetical protein